MRRLFRGSVLAFVSALIFAAILSPLCQAAQMTISLDKVVERVTHFNFTVKDEALRVTQSREAISVARGNLLPKLNLWKIVGIAFDPVSAFEVVSDDIAPFLVPNNWFRLKEQHIFLAAEREAYRALWANEVMTAKSLYMHLLMDQALLDHIKANVRDLEELLVIAESRETLGGVLQGAARHIEIRLLALQEDWRAMEVLIAFEKSELSLRLGFPSETELVLEPIALPEFEKLPGLKYEAFEFRAKDSSPEIREFEHLIKASRHVTKETAFSVFGTSGLGRGSGGDAFDSLPFSNGLGFGTLPSIRITKRERERLETQMHVAQEIIKRQLKLVIDNYNLDLENHANVRKRVELTRAAHDQIIERLSLGEYVEALELLEASRSHIEADIAFFALVYRFRTNEDRFSRLLFNGDYEHGPKEIDQMEGVR